MKNVLLLLLGAALLAGCGHGYDITMVNGMRVTRVSKPKLNKDSGMYEYRDIRGRTNAISASRVVEIAPHAEPKVNKNSPPVTPRPAVSR